MSTRLQTCALAGALLFVVALTGLFRAGAAEAFSVPPEGWGAAYERAAIEYWGGEATHCASTHVEFESSEPLGHRLAEGEGRVLGRATIADEPGQECQMFIAPMRGDSIYFRCILFAHEYGHWIGHPDSPDTSGRSVAAEVLGSYTYDPPCRRLVESVHAG
jgi:hypothetical protein